jgi:hypothetical protein
VLTNNSDCAWPNYNRGQKELNRQREGEHGVVVTDCDGRVVKTDPTMVWFNWRRRGCCERSDRTRASTVSF